MKSRRSYPKLIFNTDVWLVDTKSIKLYRDTLKCLSEGKCEITLEELSRESLDHCHETGAVRGVVSGFANVAEGKMRKIFNRYIRKHTKLSFPEFLINLGNYLLKDHSKHPLHFKFIQDTRDNLERQSKEQISQTLYELYSIDLRDSCSTIPKQELIRRFLQCYIDKLEENYLRGSWDG